MAPTQYKTFSAAIGATEVSLTTNTAGPDVDTTPGTFQVFLDLSDMVAGDILRLSLYEKIGGSGDTQRLIDSWSIVRSSRMGAACPAVMLLHGWDFTLVAIAGTVTVIWSVRQV